MTELLNREEHAILPEITEEPPTIIEPRRRRRGWLQWLPLMAAPLALWSVRDMDVMHLGDYGLLTALPLAWYASVAVLVCSAGLALAQRVFNARLSGAHVAAIVGVLFGTLPSRAPMPLYTWVYKHFDMVTYIESHGGVDWHGTIYHRWNGFFNFGAFVSTMSGQRDPITYGGFVEIFFCLLQAILVAAAVTTLTGRARAGWGAATIFATTNWMGQEYFAPQALAFTLALSIYVVLLRHVRRSQPTRLGSFIERWLPRLLLVRHPATATPDPATPPTGRRWPQWTVLVMVLAMYAAVVPSHQLTPYIILGGIAVLLVLGRIRLPFWVPIAMLVMALAYAAPHMDFVREYMGAFDSVNPFHNAEKWATHHINAVPGKALNAKAQWGIVGLVFGSALLGMRRMAIRGQHRLAVTLSCLAIGPVIPLVAETYGGEGPIRMFLFALPWMSALSFALVDPDLRRASAPGAQRQRWSRPWQLRAQAPALLLAATALFVPSFLGQAELNVFSKDEYAASQWYRDHGAPGSVMMVLGPGFPEREGGAYETFRNARTVTNTNLLQSTETSRERNVQLTSGADMWRIEQAIHDFTDKGYVAFTDLQRTAGHVLGVTPDGVLDAIEAEVAKSDHYRLVYRNDHARVYELVSAR